MSGNHFRGVSIDQDGRFKNKTNKMKKELKFPENFSKKVDLKKVKLSLIETWIEKRTTELLGVEDDILVNYIMELLIPDVDPKEMHINVMGFLEENTGKFMEELWNLLVEASESKSGVPSSLLKEEKVQLEQEKKIQEKIRNEIKRKRNDNDFYEKKKK